MDDVVLAVIIYLIIAMGFISLAWLRKAGKSITDTLISGLFRYLVALTIVAIVFACWIMALSKMGPLAGQENFYVISIFLVALFALISGSALAAKKIGEMYGFAVDENG